VEALLIALTQSTNLAYGVSLISSTVSSLPLRQKKAFPSVPKLVSFSVRRHYFFQKAATDLSLDYLITDESALCGIAFDRGCLEKLVAIVQGYTPSDNKAEWGEDEAGSVSILREVSRSGVHALTGSDA
jgi:hypothetical protein